MSENHIEHIQKLTAAKLARMDQHIEWMRQHHAEELRRQLEREAALHQARERHEAVMGPLRYQLEIAAKRRAEAEAQRAQAEARREHERAELGRAVLIRTRLRKRRP